MDSTHDYFYCYDINLKNFLHLKKRIKFICHGLHPKTYSNFWQYLINDELQQAINEFKKMNRSKNV